jgi:hypothetical protein
MIKTATLITIFTLALVPIYQQKPTFKPINDRTALIGEWMIVGFGGHVEDNGRVIWGLCNACPLIEFYKSGQGIIKYPGGPGDTFRWSVETSRLSFKVAKKKQIHGLFKGNGVYNYSLKDNNQTIILLNDKMHPELKLNRTAASN